MPNSRTEIQVPVYGRFSSRPTGDSKAEWKEVAETPGPVTIRPGEEYQFQFIAIADVRDPDLEQLVDAVADVTALKSLDLAGCEISTRDFKRVGELPWLESLNFYQMRDEGTRTLAKLKKLRKLSLEGSAVTDRGLANLSNLTRLNDLSLHACPISDRGIENLSGMVELEAIALSGCRAITDRSIAVIAELPKLHSIGLQGCWRLTDRGIGLLAAMPKLTYVGLCRAGVFFPRLLKKLGIPGNPEVGAFSPSAVEKLHEAHPDCNFWQPIDWDAVNRAS